MSAWYSDGDTVHRSHPVAEAQREAERALDDARDDAPDGWPEEIENVAWGIAVQKVVETARGPVGPCMHCSAAIGEPCDSEDCEETDRDSAHDYYAEYELRDVPDLAASIVEVLRSRPEVLLEVERLLVAHRMAPDPQEDP